MTTRGVGDPQTQLMLYLPGGAGWVFPGDRDASQSLSQPRLSPEDLAGLPHERARGPRHHRPRRPRRKRRLPGDPPSLAPAPAGEAPGAAPARLRILEEGHALRQEAYQREREALQALAEERERRHKAEMAALEAQMQAKLEALTRELDRANALISEQTRS
jgi:hypothetical protein